MTTIVVLKTGTIYIGTVLQREYGYRIEPPFTEHKRDGSISRVVKRHENVGANEVKFIYNVSK